MVGTKQGHLLIYRFELKRSSQSNEIKLIPEIMRTNKCFSRKPITQLEALPEFEIFLCLSDSQVTVHNLLEIDSPSIKCDLLAKCRGATMFVTNIQRLQGMGGEEKAVLRLCVVIKRRIALFYWKNKSFCELKKDLQLPDVPKSISWIGESLIIGFRSDYLLLKVTGEQKGLFQSGRNSEPLISPIDSFKKVAVCRDDKSYILDHEGSPILKYEIVWSECPLALVDDMPYLISLLSNSSLQVLSMAPRLGIQKLNDITNSRSRIKSLVKTLNRRGRLFACSNCDIICIKAIPYHAQIAQLVREKHFDLAKIITDLAASHLDCYSPVSSSLSLATDKTSSSITVDSRDHSDSSGYETSSDRTLNNAKVFKKDETMKQIENLEAFHLFCSKKFSESMAMFEKLGTDPILVIGLFPNLLPESCRSKVEIQYPDILPSFTTAELKNGLESLIFYLLNCRRSLVNGKNDGNIYLRAMVDTTLLKCYLQTSDALLAPLLRLKDSQCILEDSEAALIAHKKFNELIILYQSKGLHRKALHRMLSEPSVDPQRIISYLQEVPKDQLDLVFEYAVPILRSHPSEGLKIFTEEIGSETEELPRERVLEFIQATNEDLIIPYLEHIINTWHDSTPHFHNLLIYKLREKVMKLLPIQRGRSDSGTGSHVSKLDTIDDPTDPDDSWASLRPESPPPGEEPGELGFYRKKLLTFLCDSKFYATEVLEGHFKNDQMWPELALVKGKSGDHKAALDIYINSMHNIDLAIDYCNRLYTDYIKENDKSTNVTLTVASENKLKVVQDVYNILLELLLQCNSLEIALSIINNHPERVNACQVIKLLPDSTSLQSINDFLCRSIIEKLQTRRFGQIYRSLLMSQFIEVQGQRVRLQQSHRVVIDDNDLCHCCQKRIGKSAFLQYPNSHLIHYSCKDKYSNQ